MAVAPRPTTTTASPGWSRSNRAGWPRCSSVGRRRHRRLRGRQDVVLCIAPAAPTCRALPVAVCGSSSTNSTSSGIHHVAILSLRNRSTASLFRLLPSLRTMNNSGHSSHFGWATPMTQASARRWCTALPRRCGSARFGSRTSGGGSGAGVRAPARQAAGGVPPGGGAGRLNRVSEHHIPEPTQRGAIRCRHRTSLVRRADRS